MVVALPPLVKARDVEKGSWQVSPSPRIKSEADSQLSLAWRRHRASRVPEILQSNTSEAEDDDAFMRRQSLDMALVEEPKVVKPKVYSDLRDQLASFIDEVDLDADDPDIVLPGAYSTFVQKVGRSNCHFLEGFLAELSGEGCEAGRASPYGRQLSRKTPLAFYSRGPKAFAAKREALRNGAIPNASPRSGRGSPRTKNERRRAVHNQTTAFGGDVNDKFSIQKQHEACESLRILVFGAIGNEHWKESEKFKVFEQKRGSMDDIAKFVTVWNTMDNDKSGYLDFSEFLEFFAKSKSDRLLCMRCVKYLIQGRRSLCAQRATAQRVFREDMMKLIWLRAKDEDVHVMQQMFDFCSFMNARVEPPPMLPKKKRRQLLENFHYLDTEHKGFISYPDLMTAGLVDEQMMLELRARYDPSGHGIITQEVFLEMLCPYGFQAHPNIQRLADENDHVICRVVIDVSSFHPELTQIDAWILEKDLLYFKEHSHLPLEAPDRSETYAPPDFTSHSRLY